MCGSKGVPGGDIDGCDGGRYGGTRTGGGYLLSKRSTDDAIPR